MTETVFVTGADKGLGFALCRRFLDGGFHVFAGAYTASSALADLRQGFPERLTVIPLDVSEMGSIMGAARSLGERTASLDILINNAGVHLENKAMPLEELDFTDQHLEKTMSVNAFGPLRVVQQFLPMLAAGRRKLILNVSSEAGSIKDCSRSQEFAYCMSKAALNMQSKLLQNYLGPQGIKVLAVHPGWMRTDMGGQEANISADQSAGALFALAMKPWTAQDSIYLNYQGKVLPW